MSKVEPKAAPGGTNRSKGISWQELMKIDARPAPDFLTQESYTYRGSEPLATKRYTSPEFARLENEKMWPNVWQFAAREEDMPAVNDYIVYENAGRSYLVSRQDDGSVRAFHNVCLHRGRKLRTQDGNVDQFRCAFHGFTWNKTGTLKQIPCRWDFGHLSNEKIQ
jgi:phenylpropionate dioxygenase-like ring-hydroxylating dioxygenase large terminal subunit